MAQAVTRGRRLAGRQAALCAQEQASLRAHRNALPQQNITTSCKPTPLAWPLRTSWLTTALMSSSCCAHQRMKKACAVQRGGSKNSFKLHLCKKQAGDMAPRGWKVAAKQRHQQAPAVFWPVGAGQPERTISAYTNLRCGLACSACTTVSRMYWTPATCRGVETVLSTRTGALVAWQAAARSSAPPTNICAHLDCVVGSVVVPANKEGKARDEAASGHASRAPQRGPSAPPCRPGTHWSTVFSQPASSCEWHTTCTFSGASATRPAPVAYRFGGVSAAEGSLLAVAAASSSSAAATPVTASDRAVADMRCWALLQGSGPAPVHC